MKKLLKVLFLVLGVFIISNYDVSAQSCNGIKGLKNCPPSRLGSKKTQCQATYNIIINGYYPYNGNTVKVIDANLWKCTVKILFYTTTCNPQTCKRRTKNGNCIIWSDNKCTTKEITKNINPLNLK